MHNNVLRDLIYLDLDRITSIASQIEGGLLRETQSGIDKKRDLGGGLNTPIANLGGTASESQSRIETRTLHHDILMRVENYLISEKIALDINGFGEEVKADISLVRNELDKSTYVRAEGWTWLQDYARITNFAESINKVYDFFAEITVHNLKQTPDFQNLVGQIEILKQNSDSLSDRNQKSVAKEQIRKLETTLQSLLDVSRQSMTNQKMSDWMVEGLRNFTKVFMSKGINLRLYPFDNIHDFHIAANLKRDCFVEQDLEHLLFSYGSQPDVKLTVFGLIASIPPQKKHPFFPVNPLPDHANGDPIAKVSQQFQEIFNALPALENLSKLTWYPSIIAYPLAIYRTIGRTKNS